MQWKQQFRRWNLLIIIDVKYTNMTGDSCFLINENETYKKNHIIRI